MNKNMKMEVRAIFLILHMTSNNNKLDSKSPIKMEVLSNIDLLHHGETVMVPADLEVFLDPVVAGQLLDELLVVSDHHELEVPMLGVFFDDAAESLGQTLDVLPVQVGGGFIQSNNATVGGEGLRKSQSDDQ